MVTQLNDTQFDSLVAAFSAYPKVVRALETSRSRILSNPLPLINGLSEMGPATPTMEAALAVLEHLSPRKIT